MNIFNRYEDEIFLFYKKYIKKRNIFRFHLNYLPKSSITNVVGIIHSL